MPKFNCHPCKNPKCNRMAGEKEYCFACDVLAVENEILEKNVDDARHLQFEAEAENQKLEAELAGLTNRYITTLNQVAAWTYDRKIAKYIKEQREALKGGK